MKTNLSKSEKVIAITTIAAISVFFTVFLKVSRSQQSSNQIETSSGINYTMARPETNYSEYNLDGRELDQSFEGLPVERGLAKLEQKKKDLIAKKVAEAKKKDEAKKKQTQSTNTQKAKAIASKEKVAYVNESENVQNNIKQERSNQAQVPNNSVSVAQQNNETVDPTEDSQKPVKKSFAEWRNILFSKPTSETLALFVNALRKNEVTATEFQAMAQDLIDQNDPQLKGLGLMALRSVPSLASLSQLAHVNPASLGNLQAYVEQSFNAYLQNQNILFLNQALVTKDKVLLVKVLSLLNSNLAKFNQGDFSSLVDPRNRREGEVGTFSIANYRILLPALTQLSSSQDPELSSLAQQTTSYIQTSNNIAQH